jgi:acetyl/propionyl-CoA carboxylase alpha subunit
MFSSINYWDGGHMIEDPLSQQRRNAMNDEQSKMLDKLLKIGPVPAKLREMGRKVTITDLGNKATTVMVKGMFGVIAEVDRSQLVLDTKAIPYYSKRAK